MPRTTEEPVIKRSIYKKEKKKRPPFKLGRALSMVLFGLLLVVILGGLGIFWLVKDDINSNALTDMASRISWQLRRRGQTSPDKIYFDGKPDNTYATFRDGLAVLTTNRLVCYDATGKETISAEREFQNPCLESSSKTLIAYDRGGRTFIFANESSLMLDIQTDRPIITGKLGKQGYAVLVTQYEGYKSVVWVYNSNGKTVYKYYSPEYYIIDAALSPDSSMLAVSCAGFDGSWVSGHIKLFSLSSEEPEAAFDVQDGLIYELYMPGNDSITGIGANKVYFWDAQGVQSAKISMTGRELLDYTFIDAGTVIRSARSATGVENLLELYSYDGELIGSETLTEEIICQSGGGSYITLVTSANILVYDSRLHLLSEEQNTTNVRQILQRDNGTMFMVYNDYAQLFSP